MKAIKAARFKACLTGRQAAEALGIHHATLSAIETGRAATVRSDLLWRMARLYGVPAADLLEALHGPAEGMAANG